MKRIQNICKRLSPFQKGVIFILLSVIFATIGGVGVRYVVTHNEISFFNLIFWGIAGGVFLSIPYILSSEKRRKNISITFFSYPKALFYIILTSLISGGIWFYLLHSVPADTVSLFDQTAIIWSVFLGIVFFQEKIQKIQIFALVISGIGIFLVSQADGTLQPFFLFLLLFNPLFYGIQSVILKSYGKGIDPLSLSFLRGVGMLFGFGSLFFTMNLISFIDISLFFLLGLSQFFGMILNKIFYVKAHDYLPISQLNFFFILTPIFTFFISPFIEITYIFDWWKVIGAIFVLFGVFLFLWKKTPMKN